MLDLNILRLMVIKTVFKDIKTHSNLYFQTGLTALHVAAHYGQMEFCREMLPKVPATIRSEPPHVAASDTAATTVRSDIGAEVN